MRRLRRAIPLALALATVLAAAGAARADDSNDFSLYDLSDKLVRLERLRGRAKAVAVDFFSTTCGPCKKALPAWRKLHAKYRARGLRVVIVAVPDGARSRAKARADVERYFKAQRVPFAVVWDKYSLVAKQYKVAKAGRFSLPQAFLIGRDGKLLAKGRKPADLQATIGRVLR